MEKKKKTLYFRKKEARIKDLKKIIIDIYANNASKKIAKR
jgi:hypothetical protein